MTIKALIDALNNLTLGEFDTLVGRVGELRAETAHRGLDEITTILDEAMERLRLADVRGFRKKVQHAVSRLGHVRERREPSLTAGPRAPRRPRS